MHSFDNRNPWLLGITIPLENNIKHNIMYRIVIHSYFHIIMLEELPGINQISCKMTNSMTHQIFLQ